MPEITDDELMAEAETRHKLRVAESEAELRREVEAIRLVKRLRRKCVSDSLLPKDGVKPGVSHKKQPIPAASPRPVPQETGDEWPGLRNVIRRVAYEKGVFGLDEVLSHIKSRYPSKAEKLKRVDVSRELWRAKEKGDIAVSEEGAGKRPAVYKNVPLVQDGRVVVPS